MQILNLTGYGINVHVDSGRLIVKDGNYKSREPKEKRFRRKMIDFDKMVISGNSGNISLSAIKWITKQKRDIAVLDWNGKLVTSISAPLANLGDHKLAQYHAYSDPKIKTDIARWLIEHKFEGTIRVLDWLKLKKEANLKHVKLLKKHTQRLKNAKNLKEIIAVEAVVSQYYWKDISANIEKKWEFLSRNYGNSTTSRDADDPVNALFNYGYAILESECWKVINTIGLEPYIGFIHKTYTNKAPLVYDLEEPFRWLIEKAVLTILQENKVRKSDFVTTMEGNVRLKQSAIDVIVDEVGKQLSTRILYKGKKRQWGTMIMIKSRELAKLFNQNQN